MKEIRIEAGDYFVMEDGTKRPVQINTEGRWATGARPFWLDVSKVSAVVPKPDKDRQFYVTPDPAMTSELLLEGSHTHRGSILVVDGKVIESSADPAEVVAWVEGERAKCPSLLAIDAPESVALLYYCERERRNALKSYRPASDEAEQAYFESLYADLFLAGMRYQQGATLEAAFKASEP